MDLNIKLARKHYYAHMDGRKYKVRYFGHGYGESPAPGLLPVFGFSYPSCLATKSLLGRKVGENEMPVAKTDQGWGRYDLYAK